MSDTPQAIELHTDGIPILRGILVSCEWLSCGRDDPEREHLYATLKILCPHCKGSRGKKVYHWHGWDIADGVGVIRHRVAHCLMPDSPFTRRGYYIALDQRPDAPHVVTPGKAQYRPALKRRRSAVSKSRATNTLRSEIREVME